MDLLNIGALLFVWKNKLPMKNILLAFFLSVSSVLSATDTIPTNNGTATIEMIGHASLMISHNGKIIHVDPFSRMADYSQLPKADLILITHQHRDHLDTIAINKILKETTSFIVAPICTTVVDFEQYTTVIGNGATTWFENILIEAVPAYNIVSKRENGIPYHPEGEGNGYILTIDGLRIYIAGDTEDIPEMENFGKIDVAFLPMNQPYTMTPAQTASAARMVKPSILYPYHVGDTDTSILLGLLSDDPIEIRLR